MISFLLAAFMLLVLLRYLKQHVVQQLQDGEAQVGENWEGTTEKRTSGGKNRRPGNSTGISST